MDNSTTEICTIERGKLHGALKAVLSSASGDPTRPHLHGVLVEITTLEHEQVMRLVTTDGHRLTQLDVPLGYDDNEPAAACALLPRDNVESLVKTLRCAKRDADQPIQITIGGEYNFGKSWNFVNPLDRSQQTIVPADENFPPYAKVIPAKRSQADDKGTNLIGLNARYLADVAKVWNFAGSQVSGGIEFTVAGERDPIRIDMNNDDISAIVVIMPMRI